MPTLAAAMLAGGCFSYVDAPSGAVPPGREVRATLTDAGSVAVTALVGPRVVALDGRLLDAADTAITLSVTAATKRNGVEDLWNGERVAVRREYIASLAQRTFSRRRTVVAAGVFTAVGAFIYAVLGGTGGSSTSGRPRPPGGQ